MRIAIIGHHEITSIFLEGLIKKGAVDVVLGIFLKPSPVNTSEYVDLTDRYKSINCNFFLVNDYSLKTEPIEKLLIENKIDFIFVVGWSRLIPGNLVEKFNFIGWHGGAFPPPRCRGRAGVNWTLINGHQHFYYYTMLLDGGVDSGRILCSDDLRIEFTDDVRTVYMKIAFGLPNIFLNSISLLLNANAKLSFINEISPSYLPARKADDGFINWFQSDRDVDAFVRALAKPYPRAFTVTSTGERIFINRGRFLGKINGLTLAPGEIYSKLDWGGFIVGCSSGNYLIDESSIDGKETSYHQLTLKSKLIDLNPTINY